MLKKILLYTIIYFIMTLIMSYNEIECAISGETLCWYSLLGKYLVFIILVLLFNRFIKPIIFKK